MNVIVLTEPTVEPVTLEDCYSQLRLDASGSPLSHPDDEMLTRQIKSARRMAEAETKRSLMTKRLLMTVCDFPTCGYIELLRPPVQAILSVSYYDSNNTLQTLDSDQYFATDDLVPKLRFVVGFAAPAVYKADDSVRIEYRAGYDDADAVPDDIKDSILLGVQLLYDDMTPQKRQSVESAQFSMLSPYKIITIA